MVNVTGKERVQILTDALPYMQKYYDKVVVIKYGGNAMIDKNIKNSIMQDIVLLSLIGVKVVLVHGGGPEITDQLKKMNHESTFINGLRYTDEVTSNVVQMVLAGKINKNLVSDINKNGGSAVGLSGNDANLIKAKIKDNGAYGFVGEIQNIDVQLINHLLDMHYIPVISSVTNDEDGHVLNINADTAASKIASALGAENLILLTDVKGVLLDPSDDSTLLQQIKVSSVSKLLNDNVITKGMIPKVRSCVDAVRNGIKQAIIIDGRQEHSILLEIFTKSGIGTMFTA